MGIVKCRDARNGVVYVYTSERYFDPEKNKYRFKRKCIGKVDEETGEVVPTMPKGTYSRGKEREADPAKPDPKKEMPPEQAKLVMQLEKANKQNLELVDEVSKLQDEKAELQRRINRIKKQLEQFIEAM